MSSRFNRFVAAILRPPLEIIGFIFDHIYEVFFGWYDLKLSRRAEDALIQDIRKELPFLLEQGGRILPDETVKHPRSFDYAIVIVALDNLFFRFIRGRGELRVQFSYDHPADWNELPWLLKIIDAPGWESPRPFRSLRDVAETLAPCIQRIRQELSSARRLETERQLADMKQYERVLAKQLEIEINRRLYPNR